KLERRDRGPLNRRRPSLAFVHGANDRQNADLLPAPVVVGEGHIDENGRQRAVRQHNDRGSGLVVASRLEDRARRLPGRAALGAPGEPQRRVAPTEILVAAVEALKPDGVDEARVGRIGCNLFHVEPPSLCAPLRPVRLRAPGPRSSPRCRPPGPTAPRQPPARARDYAARTSVSGNPSTSGTPAPARR